jgi:hypothetical protein
VPTYKDIAEFRGQKAQVAGDYTLRRFLPADEPLLDDRLPSVVEPLLLATARIVFPEDRAGFLTSVFLRVEAG